MIDKALQLLADGMNEFLLRLDLNISNQDTVLLSNIVRADGQLELRNDSLGLCLVNVEEERINKAQQAVVASADRSRIAHLNPELRINLYILIAANFTDYETGLKVLSGAIRFFQSKCVFNHQNTPDMDRAIEKLIIELHSLNFEQQNHLWGSLGAKYLPSVLYKVRLVTIQEAQAADEQPPIRRIDIVPKGLNVT